MFISTLKKLTVAVALIATVGLANAGQAPYDFGVLDTSVSASALRSGIFEDIYKFTVGSTMNSVLAGVVGIDMAGDLMARYRVGIGAETSTAWWSDWSSESYIPVPSDPDTGVFSYSNTFNNLTLGQTYWFDLRGSATQVSYTLTLAPVPEPESYALLLAGLGLMGTIARRRKNTTAA